MRDMSRPNAGGEFELRTLERVWLQGKLKMWGRWSAINDCPQAPDMFKKLLKRYVVTHNDLSNVLKKLKRIGCSKELESWVENMMRESLRSSLTFCTDDEALAMDRVIASVLINDQPLRHLVERHYRDRVSMRDLADELNENHPDWSYSTCRRRIKTWLSVAEYMLYQQMNDAFKLNSGRFYLNSEPVTD
ncbi:DUF1133 family protein [Pantoea agglomerans]|uniref:DUF1133 family protein n=1 Tax=Enterobacter agglomerans TaxID=549 RepID=UPI0027387C6D|nr:DUF1133 family protein [Pantoea agglomerans]WLO83446.1 DUF1133 family protein [Pantoea agglomerans]